jgi:L-fuculose-phosphate aldolase
MSKSSEPGEEIAQTMRQIYDLGLTTTSGGNLSVRDDEGRIWITPAAIDKGELRADQVAGVASVEEGGIDARDDATLKPAPSSELPFHRAIYARRSDLRAVVHAHPVSLVAFSIVGQVPDTRVSAHCHALCGTVGFAAYALPASRSLGEKIAETFARGFDCVVLENHGVVVAGPTLRKAFERLEALDLCARTIMRARTIGEERFLSTEDLALAVKARPVAARPDSKRSTDGRPGDDAEFELALRKTICAIARRAQVRRLFTSTQGVLSARLSEEAFLLTPSGVPLDRLEPRDLLRVAFRDRVSGEHDARQALHATLYRRHPEVGAIAHGQGENTAGFGTAGMPLPARTIPESYILVREPGSVSFRETRVDSTRVAGVLNPDRPVALVRNDGALALGASLMDAFDRLEVLEATAAALIASRPLGEFAPMSDQQLVELRKTFFPSGGIQGALRGGSS